MLIALYKDYTELPFTEKGSNPFMTFSEKEIFELPFRVDNPGKVRVDYEWGGSAELKPAFVTMPFGKAEPIMYSVLLGLHILKNDALMAHVSLLSDEFLEHGFWIYSKKIHIQITTCAEHFSENGLPILYDEKGLIYPEIKKIWEGDPETSSQFELISNSKLR